MLYSRLIAVVIPIIVGICLVSCDAGKESSPTGSSGSSDIPYLNDPRLVQSLEPVVPAALTDEFIRFDMSSDNFVNDGSFNELLISCLDMSSCEEDRRLYNFRTAEWDQFAEYLGGPCMMVQTRHIHYLSCEGFDPDDYLNESKQLYLWPESIEFIDSIPTSWQYSILAFRPIPDYRAVDTAAIPSVNSGMTFDGTAFWLAETPDEKIIRLSIHGEILEEFQSPAAGSSKLAFWGSSLWLLREKSAVYQMNLDGEIVGQFDVPSTIAGGLTFGENRLWLRGRNGYIFALDPVLSCQSGAAVITDSLLFEETIWGLAWDGKYLLAAGEKLYQLKTDGTIIASYDWPFDVIGDIDFHGNVLYVYSYRGPRDCEYPRGIIANFRLPE